MQGPDRHVRAAVKFQLEAAKKRLANLDVVIQFESQMQASRLAERYDVSQQVMELEKFLLNADLLEQEETARGVVEWRPDAPRGPRSDAW